jgi:hypothetical protein
MTSYIEKENVVELLKALHCRVIDVPGAYTSEEGTLAIVGNSEREDVLLRYVSAGSLQ